MHVQRSEQLRARKEAGRERTIPLMSCAEDLRNAAVSAKVALQRQRAREQFDPLSLQRI